jgi:hypothetical protein
MKKTKSPKEDTMAKIDPKDGKYNLGDSKDTELEGIDAKKYDVYTETEKLEEARQRYPASEGWDWFVSYTITDKEGKMVGEMPEYTIKFDKPDKDDSRLYYYLNGTAHPVLHERDEDKANKKRIKGKLTVGDPPMGSFP